MKSILMSILLICFIYVESHGQSGGKTKPMSVYPQLNIGFTASGNYTSAPGISKKIGFSPSGFIQYNFKNWGIVVEGGSFKSNLAFNSEDYLTKISGFTTQQETKNTMESVFIAVGPSYVKWFKKGFLCVNVLGGITRNTMPQLNAHDTGSAQISYLITGNSANLQQQDTRFLILSGKIAIRYTYMLSKNIGLHFNTQLLQQFSNKESYITYHDLSDVNFNSQEARYQVQKSPIIQEKIGLPKTTEMIGVGMSFLIGGKGGKMDNDMDTNVK
ncbi:MAG: hypothetical protein Q8K70_11150 [Bacteroidota bacterium]|nr:hypothetical protein [Bacteroidota bacterium]